MGAKIFTWSSIFGHCPRPPQIPTIMSDLPVVLCRLSTRFRACW